MDEERQQEVKTAAFMNQMIPEKQMDNDFSRWLEVVDDILNFLEHDLRGDVYDEKTESWLPPDEGHKKIINKDGIRAIMSLTRTVVNKNTFVTRLEEKQINMMTLQLNLDLIDLLFQKGDDFEVDPKMMTVIEDKIMFFIYNALSRARDGGERAFLSTTTKRVELISDKQQKDKKRGGFLGIFGG